MQQSELALFAQDFQRALAPLAAALAAVAQGLRSSRCELPFDADELQDSCSVLERELAALLERVAKERATVFVFGPAKAGKSTLLDALAGANVSEVSILPSHPCVARVRHAASESARLQRFDGSAEDFADSAALTLVLQRAHHELAARVRETLAVGEVFDPARQLQRAVRRIEREQPAELLERGALELVECPPIHAPLFPSYAEMTLGEPDHARAAVFVVRAAQLCDDAVFDGIEELLAAFERLILVVNLDERARELSRAGELASSPEREDPARLITAFEELSTCAPLARAVQSGRVPVLALDLLEAARARRHGAEEGPSPRPRARLQDLLQELSRVLDVHDAFRALQTSALRRAKDLGAEARELSERPGLGELCARRDAAEGERAALETVQHALARLGSRERVQWQRAELFEGLRVRLAERGALRARELAQELDAPIGRALEDWFSSEGSLATLIDSGLEPRLAAARGELARHLERILQRQEEQALATDPAAIPVAVRTELGEARLSLAALFAQGVEGARVGPPPAGLRPLDVQAIPVRPMLAQRLARRDSDAVRRGCFGPPEAPTSPLTSAEKARRLGAEARAAMQRSAGERARAILAEEAGRAAHVLVEALLTGFLGELERTVAREHARLAAPLGSLAARLAELTRLADALAALPPACARAESALAALAERGRSAGMLVPAPRAAHESSTGARESELARE
jgi:hypothetical protein